MPVTTPCTRRKVEGVPDEYRDGYPRKNGWYDVLVDGQETRLHYYHCDMRNDDVWEDEHGEREWGIVKWREP